KDPNVLPQRARFDARLEAFGDPFSHRIERQPLTRNGAIDGHNVKSVTRLDQLAQNSGCSQTKKRLLELGNRIAVTDLAKVAALLAGGTIGQLAGYGSEPIRLGQKFRQGAIGTSTAMRNWRPLRFLERDIQREH